MPFLPYVILIIDQTTDTNPETGWDERKKDLIKETKIAVVSCYINREHLQQIQNYIKGQDKFSHP